MKELLLRLTACWLLLALLAGMAGTLTAQAQAPAWKSALNLSDNTASTANDSFLNTSVDDGNGNVYLAGSFTGTIKLGTTTLVAASTVADMVVAKYNVATSQFIWVVQAGGAGAKYPQAITVSGTSVYVAGVFLSNKAAFGSTTLTNAATNGTQDVFVAKLTDTGTTGTFGWAVRAGGTSDERLFDLKAANGGVYMTGDFASAQATFGSTTFTNAGMNDGFLAKLTDGGSSGSFAWAQQVGGAGFDYVLGVTITSSTLYMTGAFGATCAFGAATLTSAGGVDAFIAKATDTGSGLTFVWAQRFGGTGDEELSGLVASGTTLYVAGDFDSQNMAVGNTTLSSAGSFDCLLVKLTDTGSAGSVVWALRGGGAGIDYPNFGVLRLDGNSIYTVGQVGANATFGSTTLPGAGGGDALLLKATDNGSTGSFAWAKGAGGAGDDYGTGLSVVGTNVVFCGGYYSSSITFGATTLTNPNGNNTGSYGFLATTTTTVLAARAARPLPAEALYPNPARGSVTVQVPEAASPATLCLRDALGRVVRQTTAPAGRPYALDLAGLAPGLYVVQVQAGEVLATRQLAVE